MPATHTHTQTDYCGSTPQLNELEAEEHTAAESLAGFHLGRRGGRSPPLDLFSPPLVEVAVILLKI